MTWKENEVFRKNNILANQLFIGQPEFRGFIVRVRRILFSPFDNALQNQSDVVVAQPRIRKVVEPLGLNRTVWIE